MFEKAVLSSQAPPTEAALLGKQRDVGQCDEQHGRPHAPNYRYPVEASRSHLVLVRRMENSNHAIRENITTAETKTITELLRA
jgi:hypothetical protein